MNNIKIVLLLVFFHSVSLGQTIKRTFNNSEDQFIGLSGFAQFWTRYSHLNPGSTIDGQIQSEAFDLSIRRYRIKFYGAINSKTRFNLTIGNNNVGNNLQSQPKLLDAYVHYQWKNWIGVGTGKNAWVGLSRYTAPSTSSALGTDIQYGALPLLNRSDDLLRKMSIFINGQIGIADYRVVCAMPTAPEGNTPNELISFSPVAPDYQASGYLKLQFKDKEKQTSAYSMGSYHGKKEIFNIGFGALYQPKTTVIATSVDTNYYAAKSVAVDLFYEDRVYKDIVLTSYLSYHHHNLGPNFVRQIGANNPADGYVPGSSMNGKGVSRFVSGTGDIMHLDLALLKPLKSSSIQCYMTMDLVQLQALKDNVLNLETGVNFLFDGHRSKINLGYQNWALVHEESRKSYRRNSAFVIQYAFKFG
ncbi:MAG: hypothetical protein AAGF85_18505 [Bacteroidota bacterium]